ncbi:MAG: hypothetical protein LBU87_02150 [Lactobacillales bacterium]|jgi:predicted peptidase|nr:hypothetical protein [Lactobacillales bacterium]
MKIIKILCLSLILTGCGLYKDLASKDTPKQAETYIMSCGKEYAVITVGNYTAKFIHSNNKVSTLKNYMNATYSSKSLETEANPSGRYRASFFQNDDKTISLVTSADKERRAIFKNGKETKCTILDGDAK